VLPPQPGGPAASRAFGQTLLELLEGDLTRQDVDAIVNAANSSLLGGGGVDGAIHRAAGPGLLEECRAIRATRGSLPTGEAVITSGHRLQSRFVIHTVGPVYSGGRRGEAELLARCYRNSLAIGREKGLRSIAFPSISTGAFGYPIRDAAPVALTTIRDEALAGRGIERVRFVLFGVTDLRVYEEALRDVS
jgi:O-acetyl-ADP-ribose deacetylase (regulator of RNase III)